MTSGERVNVINEENEVNLWSEDKLQQIKIMGMFSDMLFREKCRVF